MSDPGENSWGDPPYQNAFLMEHKADYVKKPKHYREQNEDACIICNIISGKEETTSFVIYKDDKLMVFLNLFPYTTGHALISPIRHITGYDELTTHELNDFAVMTQRVIKMLKHYANTESFNAGWNQGEWSGGSIRHFHAHIVPRYRTDINFIDIIGKSRTVLYPLEKVQEELQRYVPFLCGEKSISELFETS